jgi:WD40 repeat protein
VLLNGYLPSIAEAHKLPKKGPKRPTCMALLEQLPGVVTSDDNGELKVWPVPAPKAEFNVTGTGAQKHDFKASFVSGSANGRRAVTSGYDGLVILHDLTHPNNPAVIGALNTHQLGTVQPEIWCATLSAAGTRVLIGTNDGQILLWEPDVGPAPGKVTPLHSSADPVAGLAFVPKVNPADPETHFLSTHNGLIHLWDISNMATPVNTYRHGNTDQVNAVAVARDASAFVSGSFDRTVRHWTLKLTPDPNPQSRPFQVAEQFVWRVAISPLNKVIAAATERGLIRAWRLSDGKEATADPGKYGSMGVVLVDDSRVVFTRDGATAKWVDAADLVF